MSTVKVFKRGETIFKEGDKATTLYLIQSGSVNLYITRQKKNSDLFTLGAGLVIGEHGASGAATHPHSAVAVVETKAIELPIEMVRQQIETGNQLQKYLMKGLVDKLKVAMKDITSMKLERDNTPCPEDQTAKIFAAVYHSIRLKGEVSKEGGVRASWPAVKQYAQRIFLESPKRFEMAANIFVKLGWAKYEMGKLEDLPDAIEEVVAIHVSDLPLLEQFFEFYQYYYFKPGKQEVLKAEERAMSLVQSILDLAAGVPKERNNTVSLPYEKVLEKIKTDLGIQLNNDHWTFLENKGLYVKRSSNDKGVTLQFDLPEFDRTAKFWKILREIDRWNEKGSVDPNEPVELKKAATKVGGASCAACGAVYETAPKFCAECGAKFTAAAA